MLASERLLKIEIRFGAVVQRIVPIEIDGETLRLAMYLKDGTNLRVTEQWGGDKTGVLIIVDVLTRLLYDSAFADPIHRVQGHNYVDRGGARVHAAQRFDLPPGLRGVSFWTVGRDWNLDLQVVPMYLCRAALDRFVLLSPKVSVVPKLAAKIERLRERGGSESRRSVLIVTEKLVSVTKISMKDSAIAYHTSNAYYPEHAPFHPAVAYPEYLFGSTASVSNPAYEGVRECFRLAGLDNGHYGTSEWNPLRRLIRPGDFVLLKPNLVKEFHPRDPEGWRYVLTHGSIIRAVTDYVWKALEGEGHIMVADAPQTDSSFREIVRVLQLEALEDFYRKQGVPFQVVDLRQEEWTNRDGVIVKRQRLAGDPNGYIAFDLGDKSEFYRHQGVGRYYGADYDSPFAKPVHDLLYAIRGKPEGIAPQW